MLRFKVRFRVKLIARFRVRFRVRTMSEIFLKDCKNHSKNKASPFIWGEIVYLMLGPNGGFVQRQVTITRSKSLEAGGMDNVEPLFSRGPSRHFLKGPKMI